MHHRSSIMALVFAAVVALPLAGCGDNDNGNGNDNGGTVGTPTPGTRTATPAQTPTAGPATPTPVPTATDGEEPTPTVTATPDDGGPTCGAGEQVVVTTSLDGGVTSARLDLGYPGSVNLPGSGTDPSVAERVDFTGNGLTVVNDFDQNGDLTDDTLTMSLVGTQTLDPGVFATVTFDCVEGQPKPGAGSFNCAVVSASLGGTPVTPSCTVAVQ